MTQSVVFGVVPTGSGAQVRSDFNSCHIATATDHEGATAPTSVFPYMRWRNNTTKFIYVRNATNNAWEILENYGATTNPTGSNDSTQGYIRGSRWINVSGNRIWLCTNPQAGSASWGESVLTSTGAVVSVFGRSGSVVANSGDYTADQITDTASKVLMTSAERTKLGNVNSYWATRTSTDPGQWVKNVSLGAHDLRSLLVYFGIPISINGVNNADYAAGQLARYDDVVLGYGLQATNHPNYSTTVSIISKARAINPNIVIWGNVDAGVTGGTSHNHSLATLNGHIDAWATAGVNGIFLDNFGYDFAVSRSRQNSLVQYIHGKNLPAMMFVTTIADALASSVNATYNPTGVATSADTRDACLFKWAFNSDAIASPHFESLTTVKNRGNDARTYRTSLGVRMYAVNLMLYTGTNATDLENYRGISEALGHIFRLNGVGVALSQYAASGSDLNKVQPYYPKIFPQPGGRLTAYYREPTNEVEAPDLGIVVHFESGNYTWSAPGPTAAAVSGGGGGGTGGTADSGLLPTSVQSTNGTVPNSERVLLTGAVSDISLLTAATGRSAQTFYNISNQTVVISSTEGIYGFTGAFGLGVNEGISFMRNPNNNQWIALV